MSRLLLAVFLTTTLVACDERGAGSELQTVDRIHAFGSDAASNDYADASAWIASDAGAPSFDDGGTAGLDAGMTIVGDGGADASVGATDAGTTTPDGATATSTSCSSVACGAPPASTPTCFDGFAADAVCAAWVDGTCRWQLVCGP